MLTSTRRAVAARIYTWLTALSVLFQWCLACGLPWGELAWGGAYPGTLPSSMRWASFGASILLLGMGWVVRAQAGLLASRHQPHVQKLIWAVVTYCALGIVANLATPSFWERVLWAPVVTLMFATSLMVAKD